MKNSRNFPKTTIPIIEICVCKAPKWGKNSKRVARSTLYAEKDTQGRA